MSCLALSWPLTSLGRLMAALSPSAMLSLVVSRQTRPRSRSNTLQRAVGGRGTARAGNQAGRGLCRRRADSAWPSAPPPERDARGLCLCLRAMMCLRGTPSCSSGKLGKTVSLCKGRRASRMIHTMMASTRGDDEACETLSSLVAASAAEVCRCAQCGRAVARDAPAHFRLFSPSLVWLLKGSPRDSSRSGGVASSGVRSWKKVAAGVQGGGDKQLGSLCCHFRAEP